MKTIYDINAERNITIASNLRFYITKWIDNGITSKTELLTLVHKYYDEEDLQYALTILNKFSKQAIVKEDEFKLILQEMYK